MALHWLFPTPVLQVDLDPDKDAAAAIRALEDGASSCPIVALTAHAIQDEKERILAAGLDHFLTKPLRKAELVALLNRYCPNAAFPLEGQPVG